MSEPPGLWNIGNTCFMNAVLQSLYRTNVFVRNLQTMISQNTQNVTNAGGVSRDDKKGNFSFTKFFSFFVERSPNLKQTLLTWTLRIVCSAMFYEAGFAGLHNRDFLTTMTDLFRDLMKVLYSDTSTAVVCINGCEDHSLPQTFLQFVDSWRTCPVRVEVNRTLSLWFILPSSSFILFVIAYNFNVLPLSVYQRLRWMKLKCSHIKRKEFATVCGLSFLFYGFGYLVAKLQHHSPTAALYVKSASVVIAMAYLAIYHRSTIASSFGLALACLWRLFQSIFSKRPTQSSVSASLAELFSEMNSGGKRSINPKPVLEAVCVRAQRFHGFRQQDSHELLRHLLDGVRDDERQLKQQKKLLTVVDKVFGGHFRTMYNCLECRTPHVLYEPFLDISLPILLHEDTWKEMEDGLTNEMEQDSSSGLPIDFLLKVFTRTENLGNEYLCTSCNAKMTGDEYVLTRGTKQTLICDPPAILCIHLKRFKQLMSGLGFEKANNPVRFSESLDLKPYLTAECQRINEGQESVSYSLYAVVVHSGSLEGGHYIAYVKSNQNLNIDIEKFLQEEEFNWDQLPNNTIIRLERESPNLPSVNSPISPAGGEWYYTSDSTVMKASADEVFNQQAYLLLYERLC